MKIPFTNIDTNQIKFDGRFLKLDKQLKPTEINTFTGTMLRLLSIDQRTFIKDGYKKNPNAYSAVNWIIKKASRVKHQLFEVVKGEEIEVFDHDLLRLLKRPNPLQGKAEFIESALGYKLISGESVIQKLSPQGGSNAGITQQMWILPIPFVGIKFDKFGAPEMFEVQAGAKLTKIDPEDIIYLKYWNPSAEDFRGMSPIEAGIDVVKQSNDAYRANMRLLQNLGAQGILSVTDDNVEFGPEQIEQTEAKYYEKYGGPDNYGRILVTGVKMKWQQIGMKATDLALLETQNSSLRDICNLYNISSQLLNDPKNKTYSNMSEARKAGITDAVIPELDLLTDEFNRCLVPQFEERDNKEYILKHDKGIYEELRADENKLVETLDKAWWLTPNQKLEKQGLGTSDQKGMNTVWVPTNLIPIDADSGSDHLDNED